MDISIFGLGLIVAGWLIQLSYTWRGGSSEIQVPFIILYSVGVFVLVVDGYLTGSIKNALLNLACLIAAVLVLMKMRR